MAGWFLAANGKMFDPDTRNASAKETDKLVANGELPKAETCEKCGITKKEGYVGYHSEDYDNPRVVESLCWRCHMMRHAEIRGATAQAQAYWDSLKRGKKWPALKCGDFRFMKRDHGVDRQRSDDPTKNPEMVQHLTPAQRMKYGFEAQVQAAPKKVSCEICGQDEGEMRVLPIEGRLTDMCWRCWMVKGSETRFPKEALKYWRSVQKGKRWPPVQGPQVDWTVMTRDHGITYYDPKMGSEQPSLFDVIH